MALKLFIYLGIHNREVAQHVKNHLYVYSLYVRASKRKKVVRFNDTFIRKKARPYVHTGSYDEVQQTAMLPGNRARRPEEREREDTRLF